MPDIGNSHVIEWYLWNALQVALDCSVYGTGYSLNGRWIPIQDVKFAPDDWTRYDGELL